MTQAQKQLPRKVRAILVSVGLLASGIVGPQSGIAIAGESTGLVTARFSPSSAAPGETVTLTITATETEPTDNDPNYPPEQNRFYVSYRMEQLAFVGQSLPGQCKQSTSPAYPDTPAGVLECPTGYGGPTQTDTLTFKVTSGALAGTTQAVVGVGYGRVSNGVGPVELQIRGAVACDRTLVIGLRGSGQPATEGNGMGKLVGGVFNDLLNRHKAVDRVPQSVLATYAAKPISELLRDPPGYYGSVVSGRELVLTQIRARIAKCGPAKTKVALIGYSQGAIAVGDAIEHMTSSERGTIKGVVQFGDPRFTPFVNGAGFAFYVGIAGPRPSYRDGVGGRTKSFCNIGDPVCGFWYPSQYPYQVGINLLTSCVAAQDRCPHMTYRSSDGASFLASRI